MAARFVHILALIALSASVSARSSTVAAQSERSAGIWVVVKAPGGGPIPQAQVIVVRQGVATPPIDHTADDTGLLPLDLRPAAYYLIFQAEGFTPAYRHMQIQVGDTQTIEITLQPAPAGASEGEAITAPISFPQHTHAVSPNGRYDLSQIDRELGQEQRHAIYFQDLTKPDDDPRRLFLYDGRIDLSWNRTSDLVAINDYAAGDATRCRVFDPFDKKLHQIPVLDEVMRTFPAGDQKLLKGFLQSHHLQLQSCAWSGARQLRLGLLGYEDGKPEAYARYYVWNVP